MLLETDAIPNVLTPSIVLIRRRDIIAQAISYYIASHTAQWSSNEPAKKDRAEIVYDGKAILGCLRSIMNSYAIFEQIRVLANLPYEEMFYEDLLDSPFSTVGGLVQRLTGHSHSPRISSIKSAIQRDDKDHELKVQFIADLEKMQWEGG
jgi:LPS sulfotransferase NodH